MKRRNIIVIGIGLLVVVVGIIVFAVVNQQSIPDKGTPVSSKDPSKDPQKPKEPERKDELHFSSREEAMDFALNRFTEEEIAIYNKAVEKGLTPEQQEQAVQIAYPRFTSAEIAALEEALKYFSDEEVKAVEEARKKAEEVKATEEVGKSDEEVKAVEEARN